jgi:TetR/AcrR family transcriptional regulator
MGTQARRTREKERRRKAILDAAKQLFFEQGFTSTTMDQIAGLVELSKGTLYLYFKSKEELYISLLVEGLVLRNQAFRAAIKNETLWQANVRAIGWAFFQFSRDYSQFFNIIFQFQHGELTAQISDRLYQRCVKEATGCLAYLAGAVADGVAAGDIRPVHDPMSLAVTLWGSLTGIIMLHAGQDHRKFMPYPLEQLVEQNIEMAIHGLTSI